MVMVIARWKIVGHPQKSTLTICSGLFPSDVSAYLVMDVQKLRLVFPFALLLQHNNYRTGKSRTSARACLLYTIYYLCKWHSPVSPPLPSRHNFCGLCLHNRGAGNSRHFAVFWPTSTTTECRRLFLFCSSFRHPHIYLTMPEKNWESRIICASRRDADVQVSGKLIREIGVCIWKTSNWIPRNCVIDNSGGLTCVTKIGP